MTALYSAPFVHEVVAQRRWLRRLHPFPHVLTYDVFTPAFYESLEAAFQEILGRGFGAPREAGRFARTLSSYDAYTLSFLPSLSGPLAIFVSRPWHDLMATLFEVKATGDINGGLHHHAPGSGSGAVHNDFNPGWFIDHPRADGVNVSDHELCDYYHGPPGPTGPAGARETVRAVAMLYYLNNPAWSSGDGGETGLYSRALDAVEQPAMTVPPINNSMLAFECTPYSYHSFISNRRHPRNSVILWLHRPKDEVRARWGENMIIPWPKR